MSTNPLNAELKVIVGDQHVSDHGETLDQYVVDGVAPLAVVSPGTVDQVQAVMRWAHDRRAPVMPVGGGTQLSLGAVPCESAVALCTTRLDQVVEHAWEDLVVIVQAGITSAALQSTLARHDQYLPLDPPSPKRSTLGGIVAANASGPMRLKYGTVRDLLIGIKVVLADGTLIKGGARVAKNVAGYDLCKLFVGQLGTLGVIVETTFRIRPVAPSRITCTAFIPNIDAGEKAIVGLLNGPGLPSFINVLGITGRLQLVAGYDGNDDEVSHLGKTFMQLANDVELEQLQIQAGDGDDDAYESLVCFTASRHLLGFKATTASSNVLPLMMHAREHAEMLGLSLRLLADAANGIIIGHVDGEHTASDDSLRQFIKDMSGRCTAGHGTLIITRAPMPLKQHLDIWGPPDPSWQWSGKIKSELDPNRILNPGRFVAGI